MLIFNMKYESWKYNTPKLPAYSWRDSLGEHFFYETGVERRVASWSTDIDARSLQIAVELANLKIDYESEDAILSIDQYSPDSYQIGPTRLRGTWVNLGKKVVSSKVYVAKIPLKNDMACTWSSPIQHYEDQDYHKARVGLLVPKDVTEPIQRLARLTGNTRFLDQSQCGIYIGNEGEKILMGSPNVQIHPEDTYDYEDLTFPDLSDLT